MLFLDSNLVQWSELEIGCSQSLSDSSPPTLLAIKWFGTQPLKVLGEGTALHLWGMHACCQRHVSLQPHL